MPAPDHVHQGGRSGRAGVVAGLALVIAVAALALSGWTWWQSRAEPSYSEDQRTVAKTSACDAFDSVRTGVATNTNLVPPDGAGDVTGALATAANARGALMNGGQYLLARLEPAAPTELADTIKQFANDLLDFGAAATAGAQNSDPAQDALTRELDGLEDRIVQLCG